MTDRRTGAPGPVNAWRLDATRPGDVRSGSASARMMRSTRRGACRETPGGTLARLIVLEVVAHGQSTSIRSWCPPHPVSRRSLG